LWDFGFGWVVGLVSFCISLFGAWVLVSLFSMPSGYGLSEFSWG